MTFNRRPAPHPFDSLLLFLTIYLIPSPTIWLSLTDCQPDPSLYHLAIVFNGRPI